MWAGVAGGLAEYFELDPALVRLMWVLATILSGGLAVPVYILAWIIMPRDDRPQVTGGRAWSDWSHEFHTETQRLAEEARRVGESWRPETPQPPSASASQPPTREAATDKGAPPTYASTQPSPPPPPPTPEQPWTAQQQPEWWQTPEAPEHQPRHRGGPRQAGMFLVGLGILLLAFNTGIFTWIPLSTMWPLIFIGLGVVLLARQTRWGR